MDDVCTVHDGPAPDLWLETTGAKRRRIPPNCTGYAQPADRPLTNQKLKAFTSWEMHVRAVRAWGIESHFSGMGRSREA